jgi:hypothetical protein
LQILEPAADHLPAGQTPLQIGVLMLVLFEAPKTPAGQITQAAVLS